MLNRLRRSATFRARGLARRVGDGLCKAIWGLPQVDLDTFSRGQRPEPATLEDVGFHHREGPDGRDDLGAVLGTAAALDAGVIVELGTAYGNLAANLLELLPTARVVTVNAPSRLMTGERTTWALEERDIGRVIRRRGLEGRATQVLANTWKLDLTPHLRGRSVDLAVVDACHDEVFVINDFHVVRPHMRPGGVVLFHDTHPSMRDHLRESYLACMRLRREGWDIVHVRDTWWAAWRCPGGVSA